MPAAHRRGDKGGKADAPTTATGGSPNVFINGRPAMREGDVYEDGSKIVQGSRSVFINGRPAARIGDRTDSGGVALTGSANVFIGDISRQEFTSSCTQAYERARLEAQEILTAVPKRIHPEGGVDTNRERNMINRYVHRNRLINKAYSKLYHDMPANRWAGLAAIVSSQMGCNMWLIGQKYIDPYIGTIVPYLSYVWFPKWVEALGEGNMAIFGAMYPALRTAADQGYEQFLKCYKAGTFNADIPEAIIKAIEALQAGKIRDAAEFLVKYEQEEVARQTYVDYEAAFASLKKVSDITMWAGINLQSVPLSLYCDSDSYRIPFTKDLTNANDRIDYFWDLYHNWDGLLD